MSITQSLNNALTGLTASSRAAELVSNNVSNALTEGYGRREIALSARVLGGGGAGVQIDGVLRVVDQGLIRDRRLAEAALGNASGQAAYLQSATDLIGTPDQDSSISGRLRYFESSLITASSRPDSTSRLTTAVAAASELAEAINDAAHGIQNERNVADQSIATQVDRLNAGLAQVRDLNVTIVTFNGRGQDSTALEDQRQQLVDELAQIVPLREVPRANGAISLYTEGGAILLDETPAEIGFTAANFVTSDLSLAGGQLFGITINGQPVSTSGARQPLGGGTLGAAFAIRDELAPNTQSELDSLARDLVERFQDPNVDTTISAGDPGLFTDGGGAFLTANELGLAGRLEINVNVDPDQGGAVWRLRDGVGATVAGEIGYSVQLQSYINALTMPIATQSGAHSGTSNSAHSLAAVVSSDVSTNLVITERDEAFASTEYQSLKDMELSGGVDTDQELQKLLLIEQAFSANARVIQTVDTLIQQLLAI